MQRSSLLMSLLGMALILLVHPIPGGADDKGADPLTENDYRLLRVTEGVVRLFERKAEVIWPGYSLSAQPFMVYAPDRWALLVNPPAAVDGFGDIPDKWPQPGIKAAFHEGAYGSLSGQLKFNLAVGDQRVVAIGFPDGFAEKMENPDKYAFSYIVHEAFHQYQYNTFGEIPWAREEKYPIGDFDNGALAWLEMCILQDALEAVISSDRAACRASMETFIAVRKHRWNTGPVFIREYEQGKELSEGTAKYVELRAVEQFPDVAYTSALDGVQRPLAASFSPLTMPHLLKEALAGKMTGKCLQPEDIPRNRIYAVAAAQAFFLDYFEVDWQTSAREAGRGFTYMDLLARHLGIVESKLAERVSKAKQVYHFAEIRVATREAAETYQMAYERELVDFQAQPGMRIEIDVSARGLSRSRVSRAKKWLMDGGQFLLCNHFNVYRLRGKEWTFTLQDAGLLEINDWDDRRKTLVIYDTAVDTISFNAEPGRTIPKGSRNFAAFSLEGAHFILRGQHPGRFSADGRTIRLRLD